MRQSRGWILGSVFVAFLLVLGVSCAKKTVKTETEQAPMVQEEAAPAAVEEQPPARQPMAEDTSRQDEEARRRAEEARLRAFQQESIHFDFDQYVIKPEAMRILDRKAEYLRQHPEARVLIEGHCDERGTNEYNLALGDRRAGSAKDYLVRSGVTADRFTTITYGEERPLCLDHDESCWWRNRRAEFSLR